MSSRLDQDREKELQPKRMQVACEAIALKGFPITYLDETRLEFTYKDEVVKYYPYSGWCTGKSIKDGRGLNHLLNQLKPNS